MRERKKEMRESIEKERDIDIVNVGHFKLFN